MQLRKHDNENRDGAGWPASLPYMVYIWKIHVSVAICIQSGIWLHERVYTYGQNMEVFKNDQNWTTGKSLKL